MISHRLFNVQSFIGHNIVCHLPDQCYIFKVGRVNKRASTFISQKINYRHRSNVILSSLKPGSQDQGNIIRYGHPKWTYIRASGLSSKSKDEDSEDPENRNNNQSDSNQKILKTVLKEKIINLTRFIYAGRKYIRISDLSRKSENIESKAVKDEKNIQFEEEKNILRKVMNGKILNIIASSNSGKKYIRFLGISNKSENKESETACNQKPKSNQKVLETDVKQNFMNTIAYMIRKKRDIDVSNSSGKSERAELEAAKYIEKENYSDAGEKVLKVAKKEKLLNIIGNVNSRTRFEALGFFVSESENAKSRSVKDKMKIQSDADQKVVKATVNESMKNIIAHVTSRVENIQALSLFSKWKDARSVKDKAKIQFDANRKVLKATVKESLMRIIARVNSKIRNIQALSLFSEWKDVKSAGFLKDETKIQFDANRIYLKARVNESIKNIIAHVTSRMTNIQVLSSSKWKDAKSVKDETKIQFDANRKVLKATVKESLMKIIAHVNSKIRNIQALSLFSEWKDVKSAEFLKDETKIQFDVNRKYLKARVNESVKKIITYVNSRRKNIGDLGSFSKWVDTKPQAMKDKNTIQSDTEQEVFMAAMKERIIELNKVNFEKIQIRPLNTDYKEEIVEVNTLNEKAKDAFSEEKATANSVISQPIQTITYDLPISSKGQFITLSQVMSDFLLNPVDLESMPKAKKKSSHEYESLVTVYWREDVEARALEVWGSREALLRELLKIELERKAFQQNVFTLEKIQMHYRPKMGSQEVSTDEDENVDNSLKVIRLSEILNGSKFIIKYFVLFYVGTHNPYSLADLCNQVILAYGIDECAKMLQRFERRLQGKQETNQRRRIKRYRNNRVRRGN